MTVYRRQQQSDGGSGSTFKLGGGLAPVGSSSAFELGYSLLHIAPACTVPDDGEDCFHPRVLVPVDRLVHPLDLFVNLPEGVGNPLDIEVKGRRHNGVLSEIRD